MPRYLLLLSLVFFGIGFFAVRFPGMPGAGVVSLISTILIALPTLVAFWRFLDAGVATLSLIALSILGFTIETTGVVTGFPYGEFYYSNALGPKIAGTVPCTLPLSWVPLVIGAVAAGRPRKDSGRVWRPLWVLMTVVLLVAIDGVLDPGAASLGFWTWPEGGVYYGVPLSNYAGWLLSSTLASAMVLILGDWWRDMIPLHETHASGASRKRSHRLPLDTPPETERMGVLFGPYTSSSQGSRTAQAAATRSFSVNEVSARWLKTSYPRASMRLRMAA